MIRSVSETGSTNDDLLALARQGEREGLWLRADTQTGGKGRSGRQWISPPGNLYASTLVRLQPGDPLAPSLALVSGIALHEAVALAAPGVPLMLKWPNDLMSGGAKLAGILLEGEKDAVICGFGVNLAHHPVDIGRPVTSLAALGVVPLSPSAVIEMLADSFARWLTRWRSEGVSLIAREWMSRAHPIGSALRVQTSEGAEDGLFDGLDPMGALRLRLADGTSRAIQAGDVFLIQD